MLNLNKPIQTRGGAKVTILCKDANIVSLSAEEPRPIVALVDMPGHGTFQGKVMQQAHAYPLTGSWLGKSEPNRESKLDLVNVVEKTETYENVYARRSGGAVHRTMSEAVAHVLSARVAGLHQGFLKRTFEDKALVKVELIKAGEYYEQVAN